MISAFILYYLNMKPTHGYEIQKFIQISGVDQWAKIQSGSIYYALNKLEKDNYIQVLREERTGSRVRKIYTITEIGKQELHQEMSEELAKPIANIGSMKFFTGPMLNSLTKEEITKIVNHHIDNLKEQKEFWEQWYRVKVDETAMELNRLSFQMTISNIDYQILWHVELLDNLEDYIQLSNETEQIIKRMDFDQMEDSKNVSADEEKLQYAMKLKNEILKDPQNAISNLDLIIEQLQKQSSVNN